MSTILQIHLQLVDLVQVRVEQSAWQLREKPARQTRFRAGKLNLPPPQPQQGCQRTSRGQVPARGQKLLRKLPALPSLLEARPQLGSQCAPTGCSPGCSCSRRKPPRSGACWGPAYTQQPGCQMRCAEVNLMGVSARLDQSRSLQVL